MRIPHITLLLATVCLATGADWHKRAPSGFTGVRGKKSIPDDEYAADKRMSAGFFGAPVGDSKSTFDGWTPEKRGPSSGFLGVRGKKEAENDFNKRAPSGFLGMRGKKDTELLEDDIDVKRAPAAGFFGVRGKKQPARSGFFGMRGKKYPYEFRGKFVGVRGKKASEEFAGREYGDMMQQVGKQLDINQLMLLLTDNAPYNNPDNYPIFNTINN